MNCVWPSAFASQAARLATVGGLVPLGIAFTPLTIVHAVALAVANNADTKRATIMVSMDFFFFCWLSQLSLSSLWY